MFSESTLPYKNNLGTQKPPDRTWDLHNQVTERDPLSHLPSLCFVLSVLTQNPDKPVWSHEDAQGLMLASLTGKKQGRMALLRLFEDGSQCWPHAGPSRCLFAT